MRKSVKLERENAVTEALDNGESLGTIFKMILIKSLKQTIIIGAIFALVYGIVSV